MATAQPRKQFHALCHEHHIEMRLTEIELQCKGRPTRTSAYACPQPDCGLHYMPSIGYFIPAESGRQELDIMPRVKCRHDGRPMFLAEVNPLKRSFRRWQCPQCRSSHTNDEGLLNEVSSHGRP